MERLKVAVLPQKVASNEYGDDEDNYTSDPASNDTQDLLSQKDFSQYSDSLNPKLPTGGAASIPSYNSQNSVSDDYEGDSDIAITLSAMEKKVLKQSFPNDTISNRLSRLELTMFNSSFSDDDGQTRLDRISSAYQAKKSSKRYDSNRFTQHASTAIQIGAILLMILAAVL